MHELFEHTADLGLRAEAGTLEELFAEAAMALMSAILEEPSTVRPDNQDTIRILGTDREYLLFDWLKELLLRFESDHMLFREFDVLFDADGLVATVRGEPFDAAWHPLSHEVKAVTYHELKVRPTAAGWLAEVIVDI